MHILILGDAFPPMCTSSAIMLRDLACALIARAHDVTVLLPSHSQENLIQQSSIGGINVLSIKSFRTKDVNYVQRTLAEFINPFLMWGILKRSDIFIETKIDLIIWYSPTIFWGPLVRRIKRRWKCSSYLILRDIFPDWALNLEIVKRINPIFVFFKMVAKYQYDQADVIGVQSPNNFQYITSKYPCLAHKVKILWNWMSENNFHSSKCPIELSNTFLANRKIFVYAGNIGVAQGVDTFLKIINTFKSDKNFGFVFVGRGSEMELLRSQIRKDKIDNVLFFAEISPDQINNLYAQCHAGLIILDPRHKTHNIPGKFVSYMQQGLPVFGVVNKGNDLIDLVRNHRVGILANTSELSALSECAQNFSSDFFNDFTVSKRCKAMYQKLFTSDDAAQKIIEQSSNNIVSS